MTNSHWGSVSDCYPSSSSRINKQKSPVRYRTLLRSSPPWNISSSSSAEQHRDGSDIKEAPTNSAARPREISPELPNTASSSSPIPRKGKQRRKRDVASSPIYPKVSTARRRLQHWRGHSSSPPGPVVQKQKNSKSAIAVSHDLYDLEAIHSGDEVSAGSSNSEEDVENEHDRNFLQDSPTQAPSSYDQSQVYRQSLLTQAPHLEGPDFATRPVRRGAFGHGVNLAARRRQDVLDSPSRHEDVSDQYMIGSFVVDDDEEIS